LTAGLWWLTTVILATQEIRRIMVRSQTRHIVCIQDPISKHPSPKGLAERLKVKALSSSPSTAKKKKKSL
jgi:hypothetical protein